MIAPFVIAVWVGATFVELLAHDRGFTFTALPVDLFDVLDGGITAGHLASCLCVYECLWFLFSNLCLVSMSGVKGLRYNISWYDSS